MTDDPVSLADRQPVMDTWLERAAAECPGPTETNVRIALAQGRAPLGLLHVLTARPAPGERTEAEIVDHVDGWGRIVAFAQARQAAETAELLARREAVPADPKNPFAKDAWRDACGQVALALRLSPQAAEQVVSDAHMLTTWTATAAALGQGRVDLATARAITEEAGSVKQEYQAVLEAAALAQAGEGRTARQVRMFTRRVAAKLDPGAAAERAKAARAERGVRKSEVVDDMGEVKAVLTAVEQKKIWDTLTTRARSLPAVDDDGVPRSLDERRADVLVDMICHPDRVRDCAHTDTDRWKADLVMQASTAAGHDEDPAELVGYGLITAPMAREIAASATWRRLVVDGDGAVLGRDPKRYRSHGQPHDRRQPPDDQSPETAMAEEQGTGKAQKPGTANAQKPGTANAQNPGTGKADSPQTTGVEQRRSAEVDTCAGDGTALAQRVAGLAVDRVSDAIAAQLPHHSTTRYRPSSTIADHIDAVHRRCRFPGCRRPSADCDLDHCTAYAAGGTTCICNLIPACRFHHRVKHLDGWSIIVDIDRSVTWTTPAGRRYRDPPPTLWECGGAWPAVDRVPGTGRGRASQQRAGPL